MKPDPAKRIRIDGDILRIELTRGYSAIADAADYKILSKRCWHVSSNGRYALAKWWIGSTKWSFYMHRAVAGLDVDDPLCVDHIDGDALNNRRANLRIATQAQNSRNHRRIVNPLGFKGIYEQNPGRYRATIMADGKEYRLGVYSCPKQAAMAYDAAAIKLHGEFAATNASMGLL